MKRLFSAFFLLSSIGFATQIEPWFPPLWEFQTRVSYYYNRDRHIQTPEGSFHSFQDNHSLDFGLNATFWPYWNAEMEFVFSHTKDVDFGYRASYFTLRYQWMDDITGDPFSLTTGATLFFPGNRFLHDFSFPYHGHVNAEIHGAIGKEFASCGDWFSKIWAYGGVGFADKGSPWIHAVVEWDRKITSCTAFGIYGEALFGLGNKNIIPHQSFEGYGSIAHQNIDVGAFVSRQIGVIGSVRLDAWVTVYARNFIENRVGAALTLFIPFSL